MINYNVNEETRTITASISGCENDVLNSICRRFNVSLGDRQYKGPSQLVCVAKMKDEYIGVAKCHPDDQFDANIGMELAKKRLLDKYHSDRVRALNRVESHMDDWGNHLMVMIQDELHMMQEMS